LVEPADNSQKARKRRALLGAASRLFLDEGFDGTTMDMVAASAGVSKPTLYNHFPSKDRLFAAVVDETTVEVSSVMAAVAAALEEGADVAAALSDLARALLDALLQPDVVRLRRLVISTADRFPEVSSHWYDNGFGRVLGTLADCLARLTERGVLRTPDPLSAAQHFVGLVLWIPMNQVMFQVGARGLEAGRLQAQARSGVEAFLHGYSALQRGKTERARPDA
jgi:TetR/AcrR family transcriptional repressor of mexJK operon